MTIIKPDQMGFMPGKATDYNRRRLFCLVQLAGKERVNNAIQYTPLMPIKHLIGLNGFICGKYYCVVEDHGS